MKNSSVVSILRVLAKRGGEAEKTGGVELLQIFKDLNRTTSTILIRSRLFFKPCDLE